jgi:hypothetical protein
MPLEILNLDHSDRKIALLYILPDKPESLLSYVEHIAREYKENKGIDIDEIKLLKELLSSNYKPLKKMNDTDR